MSSNWQRMQLLKKNAVVVRFKDLTPPLQQHIKGGWFGLLNTHIAAVFSRNDPMFWKQHASVKNLRRLRGLYEFFIGNQILKIYQNVHSGKSSFGDGTAVNPVIYPALRTLFVYRVQQKHAEIATEMKNSGIIKAGSTEQSYPPEWLNPAVVAETHPVFSIRRNGDMVFRRATPKEFELLKLQAGPVGKVGINPWRWRATLRKPTAPETEQKRFSERIKALAARLRPAPAKKPAFGFARKTLPKPIRRMRR